jgi:GT2 family glycosyltransferase
MHQHRLGVSDMRVSVIVPHYDDLRGLDICLCALGKQTFSKTDFETIVADNGSPQGLQEVERIVAGRALLINIAEKGAGPARNGGAAASVGEVLAFLDSDCVPEPQWIAEGVAALARHDVVGGSVNVFASDPDKLTAPEAFECVFAFNNENYLRRKGFVVSANLFCRKVVFDRVGGFATGVSEDVDWCHRASAQGLRIGFAPKAAVGHPARRSWIELKRKWSRINSQTYVLKLRKRRGRLYWILSCFLLPISALVHTPRVLMSQKLSGRQKIAALVILYRIRFWRTWDYCRLLMLGPSLA